MTIAASAIPRAGGRLLWLKPAVFAGALAPLGLLLAHAASGGLGANPIAEALNELGLTALVLLLASLACSPLREILGWTSALGLRRMLGLFAFFYASLHLATYIALDQGFRFGAIAKDVVMRKFIFVGMAAFLMLSALAATSTAASVQRLGFPRWKRLHRLVYAAGVLGVIHFFLRVKKDVSEPAVYAAVLALLLLARVFVVLRDRRARRSPTGPSPQRGEGRVRG